MFLLCSGRLRGIPIIVWVLCLCIAPSAGWTASADNSGSGMQELTSLALIDAVRMALVQQPDVFIAEDVAAYRKGIYTEAGGEFDLTGEAALGLDKNRASIGAQALEGWTVMERKQENVNASLGLHKKLRTGQTLSVEANGASADTSVHGIRQTGPDNIGQVFFTVVQPLGKGRGMEGTDANEEAARRQSEAALQELLHVLSRKVTEAAQAYWAYLAANRQLKILQEAEERFSNVTEQIATLIAKEELPAVEIAQARANLADARRARLRGEQALFEARQLLLLAMGIEGRHLTAAVNCRDDFPAIPEGKAMHTFDPQALVSIALSLRADYRAQEWAESARDVFLSGVKRNMAPQVDLKLRAGYTGYQDGSGIDAFSRSFGENVPGASVSMQIVASWPFSNSGMRGRLMQAQAQLDQAHWEKEKLDRQIRSDLMTAWSQLKSKISILEEARQARENYQSSLASEKKKYLLGMSTLINMLTVENQLTQAQLNVVLAQTEAASAMVTLRYQSGTLLTREGELTGVRAEDLVSLPSTDMVAQKDRPSGPAPPGKRPRKW